MTEFDAFWKKIVAFRGERGSYNRLFDPDAVDVDCSLPG